MSLRFFHVFFITVAAILCFVCAAIEYQNFQEVLAPVHRTVAVISCVTGLALLVYGVMFIKKSKKFAA